MKSKGARDGGQKQPEACFQKPQSARKAARFSRVAFGGDKGEHSLATLVLPGVAEHGRPE
jgi:hypothetical protein